MRGTLSPRSWDDDSQRDGQFACERLVDCDIKPGVTTDEGNGDAWPALRQHVLDANVLVLATPIWTGHPSSVAQRVLERMDAFLDEIDKQGRYPTFGRVAAVAVVGNEAGAHHVTAQLYQGLTDVGFTIPEGSSAPWVGEAMSDVAAMDSRHWAHAIATYTDTPRYHARRAG